MRLSQIRLTVACSLMMATLVTPRAFGSSMSLTPSPVIPSTGKAIPNQYIVVMKDEPSINPRAVAQSVGAQPKHLYTAALKGFAAELNAGQVNALQRNPHVAYLEQDQEVSADVTQVLDANGDPWGLDRIDQRNLPLSRTYTYGPTGSGVTAYVIDTGLQANHPEFGGRAANVYDAFGGTGNDCHGHGTHVAGTIGGATWGVAKSVNLRGVRVLDCNGNGPTSFVIAGVDWVLGNAQKPAVANISLGGSYSATLNAEVARLANSGVFVTVSAGNSSTTSACNQSPSSTPEAYTVAASDSTDTRAGFSSTGSCVDIYAPGVAIMSAWINSDTRSSSGSSMAAPHVAGVAALYKSVHGDTPTYKLSTWFNTHATTNAIQDNPGDTVNRLLFSPEWMGPSISQMICEGSYGQFSCSSSVRGGAAPYTYTWTAGNSYTDILHQTDYPHGSDITGLCIVNEPGQVTLRVTDSAGMHDSSTVFFACVGSDECREFPCHDRQAAGFKGDPFTSPRCYENRICSPRRDRQPIRRSPI